MNLRNLLLAYLLFFIVTAPAMKQSAIQSMISFKVNGKQISLPEQQAAIVMPNIINVLKHCTDNDDHDIDLFENLNNSQDFTQENVNKLLKIERKAYIPEKEDVNKLFELALFLGSPDTILKKLATFLQKYSSTPENDFFNTVIKKHFFNTIESVLSKQKNDNRKQDVVLENIIKIVKYKSYGTELHHGGMPEQTIQIDLSNLDLISLDGIELLADKVKNTKKEWDVQVTQIKLNNNNLTTLDLNLIGKHFNKIKFIHAKNNFIHTITECNKILKIKLQDNLISDVKKIKNHSRSTINLQRNPLTKNSLFLIQNSNKESYKCLWSPFPLIVNVLTDIVVGELTTITLMSFTTYAAMLKNTDCQIKRLSLLLAPAFTTGSLFHWYCNKKYRDKKKFLDSSPRYIIEKEKLQSNDVFSIYTIKQNFEYFKDFIIPWNRYAFK